MGANEPNKKNGDKVNCLLDDPYFVEKFIKEHYSSRVLCANGRHEHRAKMVNGEIEAVCQHCGDILQEGER